MTLSKCRWFNDHQAPCCLMIDDLVPAAVSLDGKLGPHNDWGYLMDGPDSLFAYFKRYLLDPYPEIKGTIFMPLEAQYSIPEGNSYQVFKRDIDEGFVAFTKQLSERFELAFHGIRHTYLEEGRWIYEFEGPEDNDLARCEEKLKTYAALGIGFSGGKFPGYKYNEKALAFARRSGFKWLALDAGMINRKGQGNEPSLVPGTEMVNIPTNVSGDAFREKTRGISRFKHALKNMLHWRNRFNPEEHLEYLYLHGLPITIQEHFQNQRTDGRRQTPNIHDDIHSLDRMFFLLHPLDLWHASCSEIARYFDSYANTEVMKRGDNEFEVGCRLGWSGTRVTLSTGSPRLEEVHSGKQWPGTPKNGRYLFNDLSNGIYRPCH